MKSEPVGGGAGREIMQERTHTKPPHKLYYDPKDPEVFLEVGITLCKNDPEPDGGKYQHASLAVCINCYEAQAEETLKCEPVGASLSAQTPPDGGSDRVKSCLRFIRQCVSGSCNELDLEVIRGEIDGALGEADGNSESLRRALKSLYNEVHGALGIAEPEIRAAIGNTNMECIERRLSEAKSALGGAAQEGDCPCGATVVRKSDSANKSKLCADCAAEEETPGPATDAQREKLTTVNSRELYIRAKLYTLVPSQIRAVRLKRGLSQKQLADLCGMKQARISEMETAGACNYTIATLARIAAAVGIALQIEFCTFAEMLDWQNSYSQDSFDVTPITPGVVAEEEAGAPTDHVEPTDNPVALRMRKIYCCRGAQFAAKELEDGWREIWRLEAELAKPCKHLRYTESAPGPTDPIEGAPEPQEPK